MPNAQGVPRVALVGANGHGRWHRRVIGPLHDAGRLRLVALVDTRPIEPEPAAPVPADTRVFTDHRTMLAEVAPDIVVICTPPHTHLPIARDAVAAGADLLLEKPPVLSTAEHEALTELLRSTGRVAQVGFQALGSTALTALTDAVTAGRLGTVTGIATVAAWQRPDAYYARAPWAGRRFLDGHPVLDGALANPLAHAVMQCLAVVEAVTGEPVQPAAIEVERYRVRPIEVDDTAVLRVRPHQGPPIVAAVTLAGEDFIAGEVIVTGSAGRAVLEYPTDRLLLPGDDTASEIPGRRGLLENLLAHRGDPTVPLIAPLARTAAFTAVLTALRAAPEPTLLGGDLVDVVGAGPQRVLRIRGVNAVLRRAAEQGALPSEWGVPWAVEPWCTDSATPAPQQEPTE
ncbi:Gfo/Idh/MocA family protein [Micromonospora endophytica]|uniref:Gfo/Idh/MocA family oxidoreductase n=1 Tax=Micromonospora endophytica TaxID=515350 RepID=A0A2W2CT86_9ACTN|nr:Gfo/Idh/MocA family oxidoreductase [Micromonospora endophytica]PZF96474.1 gfo/Idh/MocA family oxidoreductase [Micromonospora endophytica]RIW48191.1 gfo/Idh/MocA family oxidoreductase [Micromonospora endophytica]BCJ56779.1 oxidoreductase [Micromonospora endophytica]